MTDFTTYYGWAIPDEFSNPWYVAFVSLADEIDAEVYAVQQLFSSITMDQTYQNSVTAADDPVIDVDGPGPTPDPNGIKLASGTAGSSKYVTPAKYNSGLTLVSEFGANGAGVYIGESTDYLFVKIGTTINKYNKKSGTLLDSYTSPDSANFIVHGNYLYDGYTLKKLDFDFNVQWTTATTQSGISGIARDDANSRIYRSYANHIRYFNESTGVGTGAITCQNISGDMRDLCVIGTEIFVATAPAGGGTCTIRKYTVGSEGTQTGSVTTTVTNPSVDMTEHNGQLYLLENYSLRIYNTSLVLQSTIDVTDAKEFIRIAEGGYPLIHMTSNEALEPYAESAFLPGLVSDNRADLDIKNVGGSSWIESGMTGHVSISDIEKNAEDIAAIETDLSTNYFNKTTDTSDDVTEGTTNLLMTTTERTNLADAFLKSTDDSDDITEGVTNLLMTTTERTNLADAFLKSTDDSDDVTEGAVNKFLSTTEETVVENVTAGKPAKTQVVSTSTANIAADTTTVNIDSATIAADSTMTVLTAGIVDNREIVFIDTGESCATYNITIVGQGGELISGFDNLVMNKDGQKVTLKCKGTTAFMLLRD